MPSPSRVVVRMNDRWMDVNSLRTETKTFLLLKVLFPRIIAEPGTIWALSYLLFE